MPDVTGEELLQFQQSQQSLVLSTIDNTGSPCSSYAPFVATDLFTYYIFVSQLANHTTNLRQHQKAGVLLIEAEVAARNIYARKRFSLTCTATSIARTESVWGNILDAFEQHFGAIIRRLRSLEDFQLYCLQAEQGRWVSSFGQAFQAHKTPFLLAPLVADNIIPATPRRLSENRSRPVCGSCNTGTSAIHGGRSEGKRVRSFFQSFEVNSCSI